MFGFVFDQDVTRGTSQPLLLEDERAGEEILEEEETDEESGLDESHV